MSVQIEYLKHGETDDIVEDVVGFMLEHNQLLFYPVIFMQGWFENKLRVFTHRTDGRIDGLLVMCIFTCPVTGKNHFIESFRAGVDISSTVEEMMSHFDAPIDGEEILG